MRSKIEKPYDYQEMAISSIKRAFSTAIRSVMYCLPTGGGKTIVFGFIAKSAVQKAKNVWILCHRDNLVRQASNSLDDIGVIHGTINRTAPLEPKRVQVCSVQTLVRRMDKIRFSPDLIVIDEAHHCAGQNSWSKILAKYPKARVLGVTATPTRLDGKGLGRDSGGHFDVLLQGLSMKQLIARRKIVPLRCYEPERVDTSSLTMRAGDYSKEEASLLMDKPKIIGRAIDHYQRICPGKRTIVFCPSIVMAEHVVKDFNMNGISAGIIHGGMNAKEQWAAINALATKNILILASVDVVSEGTDIPVVEAGIMMRPTASTVVFLQQAGRIMRTFEGKEYGYLLDMVGNIDRHGFPEMDREWSLSGVVKKKKKAKEENEFNLYTCKVCFYKFEKAIGKCPLCGTLIETNERGQLEMIDGELKEISEDRVAELDRKHQKRREEGKAQSLTELYVLAHNRGYKLGWAEHRYKARVGRAISSEERRKSMTEMYMVVGKS
jgi:DNA repair protein RadD